MNNQQIKRVLISVTQLFIAIGLIILLIRIGRLDFSALKRIAFNTSSIILICSGIAVVALGNVFAAFRLSTLLRYTGIHVSFMRVLGLSFVAEMLGFLLPGIIFGDAYKVGYLYRNDPHRKAILVTTVILDRLLGVFSFLFLSSIAYVLGFFYQYIPHELHFLLFVPLTVLVAIVVAILLPQINVPSFLTGILPKRRILLGVRTSLNLVRSFLRSAKLLTISLACSLINQVLIVMSFVIAARILNDSSPVFLHFIFDPLAMITNALPIAPGGLGVAESAFSYLYQAVGFNQGATFGFLGRLVQYTAYALGGIIALFFLDIRIIKKPMASFTNNQKH